MAVYIAFLRGINVGGNKQVAMKDLRELMAEMGFTNVRTLLQSGNAVFEAAEPDPGRLEARIAEEVHRRLGVATELMVRTPNQLRTLIERNPYADEAERDPSHLVVTFLRNAPDPGSLAALKSAIKGRESVHLDGSHLYMVYPDGIGTSKLTIQVVESRLGARGTARNWNTVRKVLYLATT